MITRPLAAVLLALLPLFGPLGGADAASGTAAWPMTGPWLRLPVIPEPNWLPGHRGIDIAGTVGQRVRSPVSGEVVWVGEVAGVPSLTVRDTSGRRHSLLPVDATVVVGDSVLKNETVGTLAPGNHCLSDCLHWAVKLDGHYLDPRWLLPHILYRLPTHARG